MPTVVRYPAGAVIVAKGEAGDQFFFVTSGEVEVYDESATGEKLPLRLLKRGDHFGEISLLQGGRRTANIRALTPCECYVFSGDEFQQILAQSPHLLESYTLEADFHLRHSEEKHAERQR
jgi:CRP-like cAMP-binding protein